MVDPDVISVNDFRLPLPKAPPRPYGGDGTAPASLRRMPQPEAPGSQDGAFDLWIRRREWLDNLINDLRGQQDIDNLLNTLRPPGPPPFDPGEPRHAPGLPPATYPWSDAPADLTALSAQLTSGAADQATAAAETVRTRLHLPVDAFLRLMAVRERSRAGQQLTPAEWVEARSILVLAHKRHRFPDWRAEETGVRLDTATFVASAASVAEGEWPPEPPPEDQLVAGEAPPLVDPERLAITDIPVSAAGADARELWHRRVTELAGNAAAVRAAATWAQQLSEALGPPPSATSWAAWITKRAADLEDLNPETVTAAEKAIRDLAGITPAAFRRLAAVNARIASGLAVTEAERQDAEHILTQARKVKQLYPLWRAERTPRAGRCGTGRPAGQCCLAGAPPLRTARPGRPRSRPAAARQSSILTCRPRGCAVAPRQTSPARREGSGMSGQPGCPRSSSGCGPWQVTGPTSSASTPSCSPGYGPTTRWPGSAPTSPPAGPRPRPARWCNTCWAPRPLPASPACWQHSIPGGRPPPPLAASCSTSSASAARSRSARSWQCWLGNPPRSSGRPRQPAPTAVVADPWEGFDATLAYLALIRQLTGAERATAEAGGRLADRLAPLRLSPQALRRLLAIRRLAIGGSPVLPEERDELIATVLRAAKERLFGQWREQERGAAPGERIRLGPDSFAQPADSDASPGALDQPEGHGRVTPGELTWWLNTFTAPPASTGKCSPHPPTPLSGWKNRRCPSTATTCSPPCLYRRDARPPGRPTACLWT